MNISLDNIRLDPIKNLYQQYGVEVDVLRLDLIDAQVSGNKWFKLKEYLAEARRQKKTGIATFGGAYSNHILATAIACRDSNLKAAGIIRGEKPAQASETLQDAMAAGMQLVFISREDYREKKIPPSVDPASSYIINEGGYGLPGRNGAAEILGVIDSLHYTDIVAATGTGTTLAGLVYAAAPTQQITGVTVLKNEGSIAAEVNALLPAEKQNHFSLVHDFHFGGYAKFNPELLDFMNDWFRKTGIPSDFVYTGKLFYAADRLIREGRWRPGSRLLIIHSGGLQGNHSLGPGKLIFSTG
jgi:1-aminocyclopropane-1-carboxylate deaminase